MLRETYVNESLTRMLAIALALALVGFLPATHGWADTEGDAEVEAEDPEAPDAETVEAEETEEAEVSEEEGEENDDNEVVTYQQIAQWRANAMARSHTLSHGIHNYRGAGCPAYPASVFEGIGRSAGGTPGTCNNGGSVLADAMAVSSSGMVYRVRFFSNGGRRYGLRGGGRRWRRR